MAAEMNRKIVLEDGSEYAGYGFGDDCERVCEIVFNTAVVGYQEMISDPACTDLAVVMTYPLIGNYGIADEDYESKAPTVGALIVREYNDSPSNFRYTYTLSDVMKEHHIPGIYGMDTRKLTRSIRDNGCRKVLITSIDTPHEMAMEILRSTVIPEDAVARVSCKSKWYSRTANPKYHVVAVDCGIKLNVIRTLKALGCNITVVPYNTTAEEIASMNPDGILISSGPGKAESVTSVIELIRQLRGKYPIFGIDLGNLLIALAYGAKTLTLKFGHHGGNHPVKNLLTGKIEIVPQGHLCAVDPDSIAGTGLEITHLNLLDKTVEGIRCAKDRVCGVQFHPESAPGPQDTGYLFEEFLKNMQEGNANG